MSSNDLLEQAERKREREREREREMGISVQQSGARGASITRPIAAHNDDDVYNGDDDNDNHIMFHPLSPIRPLWYWIICQFLVFVWFLFGVFLELTCNPQCTM
jgi:hypothetical protein